LLFLHHIVGYKIVSMNRIKEILESKGIKQTWLAEKLGKSFNMVNSYVQNRRQPSLEILYKIAELLHVEAKELLVNNNQVEMNDK
jgi:transcriptional regulator with XRE-family HTH domain